VSGTLIGPLQVTDDPDASPEKTQTNPDGESSAVMTVSH